MNMAYLKPRVVFGKADGWQFALAPKAWVYLGDLSDNPDITTYRGYVELRSTVGKHDSIQLGVTARVGDAWTRGSVLVDVSYPLSALPGKLFSGYLYGQYFNGYGESFLLYHDRSQTFRLGISLFR
jgi:outer membrane phospholipase A